MAASNAQNTFIIIIKNDSENLSNNLPSRAMARLQMKQMSPNSWRRTKRIILVKTGIINDLKGELRFCKCVLQIIAPIRIIMNHKSHYNWQPKTLSSYDRGKSNSSVIIHTKINIIFTVNFMCTYIMVYLSLIPEYEPDITRDFRGNNIQN